MPAPVVLRPPYRALPERLGITRIADVTGLDRIGIPVVMVVRPLARALAVAQGKGEDLDAAVVSGVMEACESWCAERVLPDVPSASEQDLRARGHRVVDTASLPPRRGGTYRPDRTIPWVTGTDLFRSEPCLVPWPLVHTDFTVDPHRAGRGCFCASSNGLGAGPSRAWAIAQALLEVIERDAQTLFEHRPDRARARRRIDPASVDDLGCAALLQRIAAASLHVEIWNTTGDTGLPSFHVEIAERPPRVHPFSASGAGCAPARAAALRRAILEAVQSRLTVIAGARDDLAPAAWNERIDAACDDLRPQCFADVPDHPMRSVEDAVAVALERLRGIGVIEAVAVDLAAGHDLGVHAVRVVVPSLETLREHPHFRPGARAIAVQDGLR